MEGESADRQLITVPGQPRDVRLEETEIVIVDGYWIGSVNSRSAVPVTMAANGSRESNAEQNHRTRLGGLNGQNVLEARCRLD